MKKYGKIGNLWLMDRGVPTEKTLQEMRENGYKYLVGAPRAHVKVLGKKLESQEWKDVQDGIKVKIAAEGEEKFILTRSAKSALRALESFLDTGFYRIGKCLKSKF